MSHEIHYWDAALQARAERLVAQLRHMRIVDPAAGRLSVGHPLTGSRAISPTFRLGTKDAAYLLQGLVAMDEAQVREAAGGRTGFMPVLLGIQQKTIRYKRADPQEHWKSWKELIEQQQRTGVGRGDCEDLASAVAGELRFNGIPARTYVYQSAPTLYHVVVKTKRWGLLDPSRSAGMEGNG